MSLFSHNPYVSYSPMVFPLLKSNYCTGLWFFCCKLFFFLSKGIKLPIFKAGEVCVMWVEIDSHEWMRKIIQRSGIIGTVEHLFNFKSWCHRTQILVFQLEQAFWSALSCACTRMHCQLVQIYPSIQFMLLNGVHLTWWILFYWL